MLPVLAIGLGLLMKFVGPIFERVFKTYDRMNTVVQENVRGIRVVKAYVREEHETEKFKGVSGLLYKFSTPRRRRRWRALLRSCSSACTPVCC